MKNILFILAFTISFCASAEKIYKKTYHKNGAIASEGWTENNLKIEYWTFYHQNGNLKKAGEYKNDLREGRRVGRRHRITSRNLLFLKSGQSHIFLVFALCRNLSRRVSSSLAKSTQIFSLFSF